jgi:hypothetical protein
MSKEFTQKYVRQSLSQLLDKTIIEQSQEARSSDCLEKQDVRNFNQFSVSEHVLFTIANFCRAFYCENVYGIASEILSEALKDGSTLAGHFGAYYFKVKSKDAVQS